MIVYIIEYMYFNPTKLLYLHCANIKKKTKCKITYKKIAQWTPWACCDTTDRKP